MIRKEFNNGWGSDVPLKQFENEILARYIDAWAHDESDTVIINSTWYDKEFHVMVCRELTDRPPDRMVLTAMLDAAIIDETWFQAYKAEIVKVGYYRGDHTIDFWALAMDKYFARPDYDLMDHQKIDCAYMCLNRKPHWHRVKLYQTLQVMNLLDSGLISMGGDHGMALRSLPQDQGSSELAPNADAGQNGIANDIMSLGHPQNWQRHFVNVVTETWWDINKTYMVSEKIYKPILGCRPFLVYATDGARAWLTQHGFETYLNDFADITDLDLSQPDNLPKFLQVLCLQSPTYWQSKFVALREKILYNRNNFDIYVTDIKNKLQKGIACQI